MKTVLVILTLTLLTACGTVAEMRSSNITEGVKFIYAPSDTSFKELWIIHEKNYYEVGRVNKNLEQIRNGARW